MACGKNLVNNATSLNKAYSPAVSHKMHDTMLKLAMKDIMEICSIDTVAAFLHQNYPEPLKPLYNCIISKSMQVWFK